MAEFQLETERLILRTPWQEDVDLHMAHLNTPAAMRYLGGVKKRHEIVEKTTKSIALQANENFSFLYMFEKATGEMVGHCGLKRVDSDGAKNMGDFEMGWVVREDRWQRGYASEAVCEVLHWAFVTHQAPHVVAFTSKRNEPSWRLMEKLGMVRRMDLDFHDDRFPSEDNPTIVYSLARSEWENRA